MYIRAGNGATADITIVEIREATIDRSQLNANHAAVYGNITRAKYDAGDIVLHSSAVRSGGTNTGAYWKLGVDAFAQDGVIFDGVIDFSGSCLRKSGIWTLRYLFYLSVVTQGMR